MQLNCLYQKSIYIIMRGVLWKKSTTLCGIYSIGRLSALLLVYNIGLPQVVAVWTAVIVISTHYHLNIPWAWLAIIMVMLLAVVLCLISYLTYITLRIEFRLILQVDWVNCNSIHSTYEFWTLSPVQVAHFFHWVKCLSKLMRKIQIEQRIWWE